MKTTTTPAETISRHATEIEVIAETFTELLAIRRKNAGDTEGIAIDIRKVRDGMQKLLSEYIGLSEDLVIRELNRMVDARLSK